MDTIDHHDTCSSAPTKGEVKEKPRAKNHVDGRTVSMAIFTLLVVCLAVIFFVRSLDIVVCYGTAPLPPRLRGPSYHWDPSTFTSEKAWARYPCSSNTFFRQLYVLLRLHLVAKTCFKFLSTAEHVEQWAAAASLVALTHLVLFCLWPTARVSYTYRLVVRIMLRVMPMWVALFSLLLDKQGRIPWGCEILLRSYGLTSPAKTLMEQRPPRLEAMIVAGELSCVLLTGVSIALLHPAMVSNSTILRALLHSFLGGLASILISFSQHHQLWHKFWLVLRLWAARVLAKGTGAQRQPASRVDDPSDCSQCASSRGPLPGATCQIHRDVDLAQGRKQQQQPPTPSKAHSGGTPSDASELLAYLLPCAGSNSTGSGTSSYSTALLVPCSGSRSPTCEGCEASRLQQQQQQHEDPGQQSVAASVGCGTPTASTPISAYDLAQAIIANGGASCPSYRSATGATPHHVRVLIPGRSPEDLPQGFVQSLAESLQGRLPGVRVASIAVRRGSIELMLEMVVGRQQVQQQQQQQQGSHAPHHHYLACHVMAALDRAAGLLGMAGGGGWQEGTLVAVQVHDTVVVYEKGQAQPPGSPAALPASHSTQQSAAPLAGPHQLPGWRVAAMARANTAQLPALTCSMQWVAAPCPSHTSAKHRPWSWARSSQPLSSPSPSIRLPVRLACRPGQLQHLQIRARVNGQYVQADLDLDLDLDRHGTADEVNGHKSYVFGGEEQCTWSGLVHVQLSQYQAQQRASSARPAAAFTPTHCAVVHLECWFECLLVGCSSVLLLPADVASELEAHANARAVATGLSCEPSLSDSLLQDLHVWVMLEHGSERPCQRFEVRPASQPSSRDQLHSSILDSLLPYFGPGVLDPAGSSQEGGIQPSPLHSLLPYFVSCGCPATASLLAQPLLQRGGLGALRQLAARRYGAPARGPHMGTGLLHLAVASGRAGMVAELMRWEAVAKAVDQSAPSQQKGSAWDWGCWDLAHLTTPLHVAAVLAGQDGGHLAGCILLSSARARQLWSDPAMRDPQGLAPCQFALLQGCPWLSQLAAQPAGSALDVGSVAPPGMALGLMQPLEQEGMGAWWGDQGWSQEARTQYLRYVYQQSCGPCAVWCALMALAGVVLLGGWLAGTHVMPWLQLPQILALLSIYLCTLLATLPGSSSGSSRSPGLWHNLGALTMLLQTCFQLLCVDWEPCMDPGTVSRYLRTKADVFVEGLAPAVVYQQPGRLWVMLLLRSLQTVGSSWRYTHTGVFRTKWHAGAYALTWNMAAAGVAVLIHAHHKRCFIAAQARALVWAGSDGSRASDRPKHA